VDDFKVDTASWLNRLSGSGDDARARTKGDEALVVDELAAGCLAEQGASWMDGWMNDSVCDNEGE